MCPWVIMVGWWKSVCLDSERLRCPICEEGSVVLFHDYGSFRLMECTRCDLLFQHQLDGVDPRRLVSEVYNDRWVAMRQQYSESTLSEHAAFGVLLLSICLPNRGRLLEIGSGTGEFLYLAREAGWDVTGVEPSREACRYARDHFGLELTCDLWHSGLIDAGRQFTAVAFWHVLEHLMNPRLFLEEVAGRLEPGGLIFLGVPNRHSFTNLVCGPTSPLLTEPDHLFHFSISSLMRLLERTNLDPISVFSREEPHRLESDIAAAKRAGLEVCGDRPQDRIALMVRLQSAFNGHELFCIARRKDT